MLGAVLSFRVVGLPFNVLSNLQSTLKLDKIPSIMGFHSFSSKERQFYHQKVQEEKYSQAKKIHHWSHIPIQSRKKRIGEEYHYLQIRETGSIAYVMEDRLDKNYTIEETAGEVKRIATKQVRSLSALNAAEFAKEAEQLVEEATSTQPMKWSVSQPVSLAIIETGSPKNTDFIRYVDALCAEWRIQNPLLKESMNDHRLHSKRFHALVTRSFPEKRQGRKLMVERILSSVILAHGVQHSLISSNKILLDQAIRADPKEWDVLIHFMNPLILEGKQGFPSLLGSALSRSWFIQTERTIGLRTTYQGVIQSLPLLNHSEAVHFPSILLSLLKITGGEKKPNITLESPKLPRAQITLGEQEKRIIDVLQKHENSIQAQISNGKHQINLKFQRGLTKSRIVDRLGASNGKYTLRVTSSLIKLEQAGLISKAPYLGPGRRKESSWMYFLSEEFTHYREVLQNLIQERVIGEIQKIEETSWQVNSSR